VFMESEFGCKMFLPLFYLFLYSGTHNEYTTCYFATRYILFPFVFHGCVFSVKYQYDFLICSLS
jgi:hypothetical protein